MRRLTIVSLLAAPALALTAAPALAEDDSSSAQATAAEVKGVAVISDAQASSDPSGSSAKATALGVGGETVAGGEQAGDGTSSGEIVTTGDTELGSVTVGGWDAQVEGDSARSSAALVELMSPDEQLRIDVLRSEARAGSDSSSASSSGLHLLLGEYLDLYVLRSQQSGEGGGSSSLAEVNGEAIGTDEQLEGCAVPAEPLLHLLCLQAESEELNATDGPAAAVADLGAVDDQLVVGVNQAAARQETAAAPAPAPEPAPDDVAAPAPEPDSSPLSLPRTGGTLTLLPLGAGLLALGTVLRRARARLS